MMVFMQGSFLLEVWGHFMREARVPVDERQPESPAHSLPHSQARDRLAALRRLYFHQVSKFLLKQFDE